MENLILVDNDDNEIGVMEKLKVHELGLLHRAFSVFIFDTRGRMLLQQRAFTKYHSGGLWSNACCGHPTQNEVTHQAAVRRLKEELGFVTQLKEIFRFKYCAELDNCLFENEIDHVFIGQYEGQIIPNIEEVNSFTYKNIEDINSDLLCNDNSSLYTTWFNIIFQQVRNWHKQNYI